MESYETVLNFWFDEIEPAQWWKKDQDFDVMLAERFSALHARAVIKYWGAGPLPKKSGFWSNRAPASERQPGVMSMTRESC